MATDIFGFDRGAYLPRFMSGTVRPTQAEVDALLREREIANIGARFKTPMELGFAPGGSMMPTAQNVVVEDIMAQDNPNYLAEPAQQAGAAPQRTLGLLGDMFGGASALDEYMTPEILHHRFPADVASNRITPTRQSSSTLPVTFILTLRPENLASVGCLELNGPWLVSAEVGYILAVKEIATSPRVCSSGITDLTAITLSPFPSSIGPVCA